MIRSSEELDRLGFAKSLLEKRQRLIDAGIDPFPYSYEGVQPVQEIVAASLRRETDGDSLQFDVVSAGRVWGRRDMKKAIFLDLRDHSGKIQLYVRRAVGEHRTDTVLDCIDVGDIIGVRGKVFRTRTGELSVAVESLDILAKAVVPVPVGKETEDHSFHRLSDAESRYRERYLTWMLNPDHRERMVLRSKIISAIRRWMEERGFLEVATPVIEAVYGGAEARPFRTSIWALGNREAFLRISPELYLKRYIVAGFERVFTICQNFRNEGIDHSHNPEFTMMEWYEAFTDYEVQMVRFETLVADVCREIHGSTVISYQNVTLDFTPPWRRISVVAALVEEGIDVNSLTVEELTKLLGDSNVDRGPMTWGIAVAELFEKVCESKLVQPTFIIDHPVDISPLTKVKRGDARLVERFEPYAYGMEIGNAYSELTDPVEQAERLLAQRGGQRDSEFENHPLDVDFIKAIGCGMPPTGGVGLGIDRLIMLLTDAPSIRDIVPFPMVKSQGTNTIEADEAAERIKTVE